MKILYITEAVLPSERSHTLNIVRTCQALHNAGNNVTLIGTRCKREEEDVCSYYGISGGFSVRTFHYARKNIFYSLLYGRKLRLVVANDRPDIVYSRLCFYPLFFMPKGTSVFYEMHRPRHLDDSLFQKILFLSLINFKIIKRIIVTTNLLRNYLVKRLQGVDIVVARHIAEKPIVIPNERTKEFKRKNLRGSNQFSVGYTGFLDYKLRGIGIIYKLAEKLPDVDFHVVGGPEELAKYWSSRTESNNIYFYGHKPLYTIPYYLKSFDVALAPLQYEKAKSRSFPRGASPIKIAQYLSYGCAIIASDIPAHKELLENNKTALLVPHDDISAWSRAVSRVRDDPKFKNTLQADAYKTYLRGGFMPEQRVNAIFSGYKYDSTTAS